MADKEKKVTKAEEVKTEKEKRGENKKTFKNYHFPALNRNVMAENLAEATKKVTKK